MILKKKKIKKKKKIYSTYFMSKYTHRKYEDFEDENQTKNNFLWGIRHLKLKKLDENDLTLKKHGSALLVLCQYFLSILKLYHS